MMDQVLDAHIFLEDKLIGLIKKGENVAKNKEYKLQLDTWVQNYTLGKMSAETVLALIQDRLKNL